MTHMPATASSPPSAHLCRSHWLPLPHLPAGVFPGRRRTTTAHHPDVPSEFPPHPGRSRGDEPHQPTEKATRVCSPAWPGVLWLRSGRRLATQVSLDWHMSSYHRWGQVTTLYGTRCLEGSGFVVSLSLNETPAFCYLPSSGGTFNMTWPAVGWCKLHSRRLTHGREETNSSIPSSYQRRKR